MVAILHFNVVRLLLDCIGRIHGARLSTLKVGTEGYYHIIYRFSQGLKAKLSIIHIQFACSSNKKCLHCFYSRSSSVALFLISLSFAGLSLYIYSKFVDMTINLSLIL